MGEGTPQQTSQAPLITEACVGTGGALGTSGEPLVKAGVQKSQPTPEATARGRPTLSCTQDRQLFGARPAS